APSGKATHNLLRLARETLLIPLRSALQQVKKDDRPVRKEGLRTQFNGHSRTFNLEIIPITSPAVSDRKYLVIFEPTVPAPSEQPAAPATDAELRQELQATREYLQSVIEQQEAYSQELQSANEEIQSSNEELQSINEELETSKEELQSSNEELTTVN